MGKPLWGWVLGLGLLAGGMPGQAIVPYVLELPPEQLEAQGVDLAREVGVLSEVQALDGKRAIANARLATQLAPNRFEPWVILAQLYLRQDELKQATA
ncbi:MAG: hypothetical protein Q6J33_09105, partial [Gloeomargarita sp. DG_2_bins_126]